MLASFMGRERAAPRMALITGASSGIGKAFAKALPDTTEAILVGRSHDKLEEVAGELRTPGREVHILAADLTRDDGRQAVIDAAEQHEVDLLINNAGAGKLGALIDHSAEEERAVVELNVVTPLVVTHALLPGMIARANLDQRRAGVIIVSSEAAFAPLPYFASYAASKAFDLVLAESLAEELRREPIDVMALCPGATRTEFGSRAGFSLGSLPGAADPDAVAREALGALGRQRVLVSGYARRAALTPLVASREIAARGLGTMTALALRWRS